MSDFFEKLSGSKKIEDEPEEIKTSMLSDDEPDEQTESTQDGQLAVDVFQTENEIIIQSTIAGIKSENLDVTIQNDMVSIKGERRKEMEAPEENYFYQECYWGPFSRSIILPEEIKAEAAKAVIKDGVLTLRLPKAEKTKTTKIKVIQSE